MPPLSAVILTHNSAETIEATLAALGWCDELLVVDSGSTDATSAICQRFGARVIHRPLTGFGEQKRFAALQARNDWVFVVDSDEVVTEALRDEILALFSGGGPDASGYEMAISLVFLGRLLRFGGEYNKAHLRLFDRRAGNFDLAPVHEQVEVRGRVRRLRGRMLHYSYRDIEHYLQKFNRYTSLAARDLCNRRKTVSAAYIAIRTPITFLRYYVLKGCALDGYPGFVWSLLCALYPTVKFIKLREMLARERSMPDKAADAGRDRPSAPAADAQAA